ncbi:MAG: hypothetical protein ABI759_01440 [Candidatus Solibacter sp.]
MACALPCIVTGYSGLTEFAHEGNSYQVSVAGMVPVQDSAAFDPACDWGEWAQPDLEELRYLMRFVYQRRDHAQSIGVSAREEAVRLWTWTRAASQAATYIRELRRDIPA